MYPISSIPGSKTFGIPGNPWLESSILLCIPSDTQPFSALTKLLPELERLSPWKFSLKENKTQFGSRVLLQSSVLLAGNERSCRIISALIKSHSSSSGRWQSRLGCRNISARFYPLGISVKIQFFIPFSPWKIKAWLKISWFFSHRLDFARNLTNKT